MTMAMDWMAVCTALMLEASARVWLTRHVLRLYPAAAVRIGVWLSDRAEIEIQGEEARGL
jgi:hypothetical protein